MHFCSRATTTYRNCVLYYKCDLVRQNQSYNHQIFTTFLTFESYFFLNSVIKWIFPTYVKIFVELSKVYRIVIAYTEKEIYSIKPTYIFSGYKTDFVRPELGYWRNGIAS